MNKKLGFIALAIVLLLTGITYSVSANAIFFLPTVQTATATSSMTLLTAVGSSTTLILDSYAYAPIKGAVQDATLLLQAKGASTTASSLGIVFTYSQDGIDYYGDVINVASTTLGATAYSWLPGSLTTVNKAMLVKTPTRFVKVTFTAVGATSSVWAQFVPQRQVQ